MGTLYDWSTTPASNTTCDGVNIAENCPAANVNNAMRSIMALTRNTFTSNLQTFLAGSAALGVAYGGTGLTGTPANGQLAIGNGTGFTLATLTAGTGVTVTNASGTITIAATATVTSVDASGGTTGLSFSGGPITSSGTLTLAGTLIVANGGTGATTAAGARSNLSAAASGANSDITSLSALSTPLSIGQGGTGSASTTYCNLASNVTGTLPVANGGTGGTTQATARSGIGLGTISTFDETTAAQFQANTSGKALSTDKVWSAAAEVTLTDAATVAVDMSTFLNARVTLGGNRTLGTPSNAKVGQSGYIAIVQDGTGSRTLAYAANWKFAGGTAPTLTTTASAVDLLFYQVMTSTFIYATLVKDVK